MKRIYSFAHWLKVLSALAKSYIHRFAYPNTRTLLLPLALSLISVTGIKAQSLTFTVNPQVQCFLAGWNPATAGITSTVGGTTSYSWSVSTAASGTWCAATYSVYNGGLSLGMNLPCQAVYSIQCQAYNGSSLQATYSTTAAVNPSVAITFSGNTSVCAGQAATISVISTAGSTFTWLPVGITGTQVVLSPTANSVYTVTGTNTAGCTSSGYLGITVQTPGTLSISGGSVVCNNSGLYFNVSGGSGSNYTWQPGNMTGSGVLVQPQVNTCYTVTSFNSCGTMSATQCVTVSPTPTVNWVVSNSTVCPGTPVTISASGANTYTWYWPGGSSATGPSVTVTPTYNQYTVVLQATGSTACTFYTAIPLYIATGPPIGINISPSNTVCAGNSATISASGAASYTWNPGNIVASSIVINPTSNISYSVSASHTSGCNTFSTVNIYVPSSYVAINTTTNLCSGQSRTLSVSSPGSYTWTDGNNNLGSGNSVIVSPTVNTCYTVTGTNSSGCLISGNTCLNIVPVPTVSINGATSTCFASPLQLTASGATFYQWAPINSTATSVFVYPTSNTCYTLTGYNSWGCPGIPAVHCVSVLPAPSFTNNSPFHTICQGSTVTLANFFSNTNYTVFNSGLVPQVSGSGTTVVMSPTASGVYTVSLTSPGNNCYAAFTTTIILSAPPSINISGNNSVCQGGSATLLVSGGSSYTWSTGNTGPSVLITPTANTCYTVFATNPAGCTNFAVKCITVNPAPVITISGTNALCAGSSVNLIASGANSYVWSNNATGTGISVSPSANTCYSVVGSSGGCTGTAAICLTVFPAANIQISPSSATVCRGSSVTFTTSGANSYTWSTGAGTATLNVLPLATSSYTVAGHSINGCSGANSATVAVDTTCSNVWPGDANSDGVVGTTDVLELGFAYLNTGSARSGASNNYVAQFANNWSGTVSSGKNKCHADCNGDGTVNNADTVAIYNNFSLTHAFRSSAASSDFADVMLVSNNGNEIAPGQWNKLDIVAGDETNTFSMYGIALDINFDPAFFDNNAAYIVYTPSFLNNNNPQVEFRKTDFGNGKVYAASVRTDGLNAAGNGKIGEFHFKVRPDAELNIITQVSVSNALKVDADHSSMNLSGNSLELVVSANPVGLPEKAAVTRISFFPNPASGRLLLHSSIDESVSYRISDISGRLIMTGNFMKKTELNTSEIENGAYFISFETKNFHQSEKLLIQR